MGGFNQYPWSMKYAEFAGRPSNSMFDGWMDGQEWIDRRTSGWMDKWMEKYWKAVRMDG